MRRLLKNLIPFFIADVLLLTGCGEGSTSTLTPQPSPNPTIEQTSNQTTPTILTPVDNPPQITGYLIPQDIIAGQEFEVSANATDDYGIKGLYVIFENGNTGNTTMEKANVAYKVKMLIPDEGEYFVSIIARDTKNQGNVIPVKVNRIVSLDPNSDRDGDGLSYKQEKELGTDPNKPNLYVSYALKKGLSVYIEEIKPLDENGIFNYYKRVFIDELYALPDEIRKDAKILSILINITQDGDITNEELTRFQDLDQDGVINNEELSVYQTNPLVAEAWDNFDTVTKILNTPEKVSNYMKNNIKYEAEPIDQNINQDALLTFIKKSGDCEDHAMFVTYILLKNGYAYNDFEHHNTEAVCILDVQWGRIGEPVALGHAVCLYNLDGQFFYLDNSGYKKGPFSSLIDVVNNISIEWKLYQFVNENWEVTKKITR